MNNRYNIVYMCTYLDEYLSVQFALPYVPAGLKKKNSLIKALSDHTIEIVFVSIFSRIPGNLLGGFFKNTNLTRIHVPWFTTIPVLNYLLNPLFSFMKIALLDRKQKIDFLILYNCVYENVIPAFFAKRIMGINIITQYEDGWVEEDKGVFKNIINKISHNLAKKIADGLIANSETFLEIFPKKNYFIFRGSVDHLKYCPGKTIENSKMNILFASSIDHVRGAMVLIDFLNKIEDKYIYRNMKIFITGRGNDHITNLLIEAARCFNERGGDVEFLGFVSESELKKIYSKTDVFLALQDPNLSFSKYCFPSKVLEFYYYNKPVITTDISDIKGLFPNLIFSNYDTCDIKDKIIYCFKNYKQLSLANSSNSDFLKSTFSDKENRTHLNKLLNKVYKKNV